MSEPTTDEPDRPDEPNEELKVMVSRRRDEATAAGMTLVEARMFSESNIEIGELRHLVELHCPTSLIPKILL